MHILPQLLAGPRRHHRRRRLLRHGPRVRQEHQQGQNQERAGRRQEQVLQDKATHQCQNDYNTISGALMPSEFTQSLEILASGCACFRSGWAM